MEGAPRARARCGPSFVSVTYGAGGSTRDRTVAVTERIATETTLTPLAHLTAVDHSVAELRHVVGRQAAAGRAQRAGAARRPARRPAGRVGRRTPRGCTTPSELVALVKSIGRLLRRRRRVPGAAPALAGPRHRRRDLRGASAGPAPTSRSPRCSSGAEDYLRLRDRVAAAGCDVPIIAGVMPVTNVAQIERIAQLSGAAFPADLAERFARGRRRPAGGQGRRPGVRRRGRDRAVPDGCSPRACRASTSSR